MEKTLVTRERLEKLGFKPCCSFWNLESKDLLGSITEEVTPTHELGENSLDVKRYYCVKLHNKKNKKFDFLQKRYM